jgi:Methyltransferase domain
MFDFSEMIHAERSKRLALLPQFSGTVLSAGCSGSWYFKWFEECTGHKGKHIGLELYSPEPTDLPVNVQWVANSVGNMDSINNATIDMLFSGQNIEHLPQQDLTGFLLESNRVLKNNGLLVIDSPNRSVTQHLGYIQPEHTLELTADETVALLEASGFEVLEVHGVWLVIDPGTLKSLDIFTCKEGELSCDSRQHLASTNPDKSFIWWINARKKNAPDRKLVRELSEKLFWRNYKSFINARFSTNVGTKVWNWGGSVVTVAPTDAGYALYGPYIPLAPGSYRAIFHIKGNSNSQPQTAGAEVTLDIVSTSGTAEHGRRSLDFNMLNAMQSWQEFTIPFTLTSYTTGVEARVLCQNFSGSVAGTVDFLPD